MEATHGHPRNGLAAELCSSRGLGKTLAVIAAWGEVSFPFPLLGLSLEVAVSLSDVLGVR